MGDRFANLAAPARLMLFAALLALVGAAAVGVGAATRDDSVAPRTTGDGMAMSEPMTPTSDEEANGLSTSAAGFTFEPARTSFALGSSSFRFRIADSQGNARHDFTREGGVELHLIVVRRDLVGYTHVHPVVQADGSWLVRLNFTKPGVYRAFADFERAGEKTVLGTDLFVAGQMKPERLPAVQSVTTVGGYDIELASPQLHAGKAADVEFTVTHNGTRVPSFQSYVGMRGHLVTLHTGDLSYSHVHPLATNAPGQIGFRTELRSAGTYRAFLQFKIAGSVHTAPFTLKVVR
ncbi:MAG: hypothetical protein ACJ757_11250 [Gaiellaceae bacterium]